MMQKKTRHELQFSALTDRDTLPSSPKQTATGILEMDTNLARTLFFGLVIAIGLSNGSQAKAQHFHCHGCGCSEKPHSKVRLVKTYKQVSIPNYVCNSQETFYPQKGMVFKHRNQVDSFVVPFQVL